MNAAEIIRQIELLPPDQKEEVVEFVKGSERKTAALSPGELVELADQMVAAESKERADALEAEIVEGFYGK